MSNDDPCTSNRSESRELKVILSTRPFRKNMAKGMARYEKKLAKVAKKHQVQVENKQQPKVKEQKVWYLDTRYCQLFHAGYILRCRQEWENDQAGDLELGLKFRYADPEVVNSVHLSSAGYNNECKYEQDIVPAFEVKYSRSNNLEKFPPDQTPTTLGQLRALYPNALATLAKLKDKKKLHKACHFTARETASKNSFTLNFGKELEEVETGFNFWHQKKKLVVAEFSFKYALKKKGVPEETAQRVYDFFLALQSAKLWYNPTAKTKSQFVYGCCSDS